MLTLLALGAALFVLVAVFGLLASLVAFVFWILFLPFRILGWVFKAVAGVLALPFVVLFAVLGAIVFAAGFMVFFIPFFPFALLAVGIWWLLKRRGPAAAVRTP